MSQASKKIVVTCLRAKLTKADIECSNGVFHVIDSVLIPREPGEDGPANEIRAGEGVASEREVPSPRSAWSRACGPCGLGIISLAVEKVPSPLNTGLSVKQRQRSRAITC